MLSFTSKIQVPNFNEGKDFCLLGRCSHRSHDPVPGIAVEKVASFLPSPDLITAVVCRYFPQLPGRSRYLHSGGAVNEVEVDMPWPPKVIDAIRLPFGISFLKSPSITSKPSSRLSTTIKWLSGDDQGMSSNPSIASTFIIFS